MDEETINLIMSLQIEDLEFLVSRRKGKSSEGSPPSDEELAIDYQRDELQVLQSTFADFRMARSISSAVQNDGATVTILTAEERRSAHDHQMARQLSGQPSQVVPEALNYRVNEDVLARFSSLNISEVEDNEPCDNESISSFGGVDVGESSSWAARRKTTKVQHECSACTEIRETIQMPCEHQYCRTCVVRLVTDATVDESLFPLRCCRQNMPLSLIRPYISTGLALKIEQKAIEFSEPYRTYCFSCGLFISIYDVQGHRGHCLTCNQDTCILCKGEFHTGDCAKDVALETVLRIANAEGWQRCLGCHTMVERREGCNHIRCRCRTEFCYECGMKWKNCTCVVYTAEMLLQRAGRIADRPQQPGAAAILLPRRQQVQQIARTLDQRHNCDHRGRRRRVEGPHQCEECRDRHRKFILECRHCMLQACARCRMNRL